MPPATDDDRTLRRGVWLFPGIDAGALVDAMIAAEELGLDEVWIADEGVGRDPLAILAAGAAATKRILLATGITSPVLRHPGAIAASIATVDELSDGRAILGLGIGGDLTLAPLDLVAERPVALLRDAVALVRAVHSGSAVPGYDPPDHAIPARSIPIWIGARGPQLVRLAARVADGLFLSGCTAVELDSILDNAATVGPVDVAIYQTAVDLPSHPSELGWDAAHDALAAAVVDRAPRAIGVNLVQLTIAGTDPVPLVERAAELLRSV